MNSSTIVLHLNILRCSRLRSRLLLLPQQSRMLNTSLIEIIPNKNKIHLSHKVSFWNYQHIRCLHFASTGYDSCFTNDQPSINKEALRKSALEYLEKFDSNEWFDKPVRITFTPFYCFHELFLQIDRLSFLRYHYF